jgi:hypothetical protein
MSITYDGKWVIHPNDGDHVKWSQMVHFEQPYTPCVENGNPVYDTMDCKVKVKKDTHYGEYFYSCSHCPDPEIVVGSDEGNFETERAKAIALNADYSIKIACNGTMIMPVQDPAGDIPNGKLIRWQPRGGDGEYPLAWTVTWGQPAPMCREGNIDQNQRDCTVTGESGKMYSYTVNSTNPTCNGMSSIKIK